MTHIEALAALAKDVMGWEHIVPEAGRSRLNVFWVDYKSIRVKEGRGSEGNWNPFDPNNIVQALDLAEAWCKMDGASRTFTYEFAFYLNMLPGLTGPCCAEMKIGRKNVIGRIRAATFSEALTGAVCKAEGIEVENAR